MTDIVERLNNRAVCSIAQNSCRNDARMLEASYEIERLREALRRIADGPRDINKTYAELFAEVKIEARAALGEDKE